MLHELKCGQYWFYLGNSSLPDDEKSGHYGPWKSPSRLTDEIFVDLFGYQCLSFEKCIEVISAVRYVYQNNKRFPVNPQCWKLVATPCVKCNQYCQQRCFI